MFCVNIWYRIMNPPPTKPWDSPRLQNNSQVLRNDGYNMGPSSAPNGMLRSVPVLPPRPQNSVMGVNSGGYSTYGGYNSYSMPYSSKYVTCFLFLWQWQLFCLFVWHILLFFVSVTVTVVYLLFIWQLFVCRVVLLFCLYELLCCFFPGYGYGSYGSLPYRSSLYGNCGYGMYNMGGFPTYATNANGEAERRFVQYAEQQSRSTFANIENIVQAVSSFALMLDNTFFAMTSSFRAVLSVAEHFGRLRSVFGHIWYTINVFRLFNWFYKKFLQLLGKRVPSGGSSSLAWKEAASGGAAAAATTTVNQGANVGSNFSTLAFLGLIISTPYLVSKFLPKYEGELVFFFITK